MKGGAWLEFKSRSDEALIGTPGVSKALTVRRLTHGQKRRPDMVRAVQGIPRKPSPKSETDQVPIAPNTEVTAHDMPPTPPSTRQMYIRKQFIEPFGKTTGCAGCRSMGTSRTTLTTLRAEQ